MSKLPEPTPPSPQDESSGFGSRFIPTGPDDPRLIQNWKPVPPTETREVLSDYAIGLIADGLELPYVWVVRKMAQEIRDRRAAVAPSPAPGSQEDGNV